MLQIVMCNGDWDAAKEALQGQRFGQLTPSAPSSACLSPAASISGSVRSGAGGTAAAAPGVSPSCTSTTTAATNPAAEAAELSYDVAASQEQWESSGWSFDSSAATGLAAVAGAAPAEIAVTTSPMPPLRAAIAGYDSSLLHDGTSAAAAGGWVVPDAGGSTGQGWHQVDAPSATAAAVQPAVPGAEDSYATGYLAGLAAAAAQLGVTEVPPHLMAPVAAQAASCAPWGEPAVRPPTPQQLVALPDWGAPTMQHMQLGSMQQAPAKKTVETPDTELSDLLRMLGVG